SRTRSVLPTLWPNEDDSRGWSSLTMTTFRPSRNSTSRMGSSTASSERMMTRRFIQTGGSPGYGVAAGSDGNKVLCFIDALFHRLPGGLLSQPPDDFDGPGGPLVIFAI